MDRFDAIINRGFMIVWAVLGLGALAGVIFAGAWWHLFTAAISAVMFMVCRHEEKQYKEND